MQFLLIANLISVVEPVFITIKGGRASVHVLRIAAAAQTESKMLRLAYAGNRIAT